MSEVIDWLPELMTLSDYGGEWRAYLDAIYEVFCEDFLRLKPKYPGKRLALKCFPMALGKEATFWHLIQEGDVEQERTPDLRRCERIRWPRPIIETIQTDKVRVWQNTRGKSTRTVIATNDYSYVVILDDRKDYVLLWTAYCVEQSHRRRKLEREFLEWTKSRNS
jgi:hypothetical protein